MKDPLSHNLPDAFQGILAFAVKLTREPHAMTQSDVAALRGAGLTDRGVLETVQVTAYFNFVNRLVDGLGVTLEPDHPG